MNKRKRIFDQMGCVYALGAGVVMLRQGDLIYFLGLYSLSFSMFLLMDTFESVRLIKENVLKYCLVAFLGMVLGGLDLILETDLTWFLVLWMLLLIVLFLSYLKVNRIANDN